MLLTWKYKTFGLLHIKTFRPDPLMKRLSWRRADEVLSPAKPWLRYNSGWIVFRRIDFALDVILSRYLRKSLGYEKILADALSFAVTRFELVGPSASDYGVTRRQNYFRPFLVFYEKLEPPIYCRLPIRCVVADSASRYWAGLLWT
jgi:hypothetical protein